MKWFVYMVKCLDESLYTGISTDVERRIREHNNKRGSKALMGRLPVRLVYQEEFATQKDAARREREIKRWSRTKKLKLIEGFTP